MAKRPARSSAVSATQFSTEAIDGAALEALALARKQRVRAAVAGGRALQWFGSERFTRDVDIVAEGTITGLKFRKPVTFGGAIYQASNGVSVDWIVRSDEAAPLYQEALFAARRLPGCPYLVISAEYLVAMKFVAGREKDRLDIAALLQLRKFNARKARGLIHKHIGWWAAREFGAFIEEARWLRKYRQKED